jgi:hypothetical protein
MHHALRPPLASAQRLQRLSLWLCLALAWFAAHVLTRLTPHAAARVLARHAHAARLILAATALRAAGVQMRSRSYRPAPAHRLTCRRLAGSRLRRALRLGAPGDRARAIAAVLAAPERWIAYLVRRLRRRFTKLGRLPKPALTRVRRMPKRTVILAAFNSS